MRNIIFLGLVSFFADISTEMVYPVLPLYLTAAFGASPALLGLIEGIAESVASLLKVFSGYLTDRWGKKKPVAFAGYAAGLLYKAALLFASSWAGVLAARVIDRLGKGVRTAPRDVMVSESAGKNGLGKAFGVHKALDMAGAATGILLSYLLIGAAGARFTYKSLFMVSAIPAFIGLSMFLFVKEKQSARPAKTREQFWNNARLLPGGLKLYLTVAFLFTLGNSSNAFLLLRAKSAGFDDASVILLYFLFNVTAAALSIPLGRLSDRVGRKRLLVWGYVVFSIVYLGFAFASGKALLIGAFALYGGYTAMTAGVERAFIAEISPPQYKGTMLGMHATLVGIALLPASVLAGLLWDTVGTYAPFVFGAVLSLAAALILQLFLKGNVPAVQQEA